MRYSFSDWETDVKNYCNHNQLSFEKAKSLAKGYCKNQLLLAYPDPEKGKMGMLDDTPMPLVLRVSRENGKLIFEQTEYTKKYLEM